jgi:muramoyltetrapeptide carboxypeptidase
MIRPSYLKPGDTIGITCPARKISLEEIQPAIQIFKNWGLKVLVGDTVGKSDHQFGGTDAERRADLQRLLNNPEVKAVISARGGYGTVRIMDDLDLSTFMDHPKWIVGFSDLTFLHTQLNSNIGVETIHATMPLTMPANTYEAVDSLRRALFGEKPEYTFERHPLNRNGVMQGDLVGGNLSILYSILGTKTILQTANSILFLEDLDEYLYHVDRMMMALKRAGKLANLKGLVVGGMTEMKDNTVPFGKTAEEIVWEHVQEYDYPVCFGFPAGHIPDNRAIYLGRTATIQVSEVCHFSQ